MTLGVREDGRRGLHRGGSRGVERGGGVGVLVVVESVAERLEFLDDAAEDGEHRAGLAGATAEVGGGSLDGSKALVDLRLLLAGGAKGGFEADDVRGVRHPGGGEVVGGHPGAGAVLGRRARNLEFGLDI